MAIHHDQQSDYSAFTTPSCSTCRFFKPAEYVREKGQCRVHAPQVIPLAEFYIAEPHKAPEELTLWPAVRPDDWCGEFALKTH